MAKSCKRGYYYCNTSKKCKKIPKGYHVMSTGYLMRDNENQDEKETEGKKKNGNGNGNHSNGNGNGNGSSSDGGGEGGGGGVSEAWSAKYKKSIDCDNPKGFSQKSHCRGKEKVSESKSGDSSLRDWFSKSKSSDGKPGWVQLGGKYAGKPCAKQPGQKTKPKCGSSKMAANLNDKEEKKAFNRKQRQDPNPNRKGKAINVKTESYSNWREELNPIDEGAANVIRAGLAIGTGIAGLKLMDKARDVGKSLEKRNKKMQDTINKARGVQEEVIDEGLLDRIKSAGRDVAVTTGQTVGRTVGTNRAGPIGGMIGRNRGGKTGGKAYDQATSGNVGGAIDTVRDALKNSYEPEGEMVDEGKKDACYHKVKSRYSVWPSAYASGALVKCRKVGAKNWGNKTKNENYEFSNWKDNFHATEVESIDLISNEPLQPTQGLGSDMLDEKCWKGYKKKGMKTMFGKRYPNCVKAHFSDWRSDMDLQEKEFKSHKMYDQKTGKGYDAETEEDHLRMKKMGYTHEKPEKKNCGCGKDPCKTYGKQEVKEDWQKSNRKDNVDGMSQKSVNAYKRENPGSKLKTAVTGKNPTGKDKSRRKSFCARSNGQRKMHNIDCSKTPDKKICKARKRWRC
jgi:hypothetical protein